MQCNHAWMKCAISIHLMQACTILCRASPHTVLIVIERCSPLVAEEVSHAVEVIEQELHAD